MFFVENATEDNFKTAEPPPIWKKEMWRPGQSPCSGAQDKTAIIKNGKEWQRIEEKIQKAESEVVKIEVRLHAPENVNNLEELQKLSEQLVAAEGRVQELYDRWAELDKLFS